MESKSNEYEHEEELSCVEDAETGFDSETFTEYESASSKLKPNLSKPGDINSMTFVNCDDAGNFYFRYGKSSGFAIRACHLRRDNKTRVVLEKEWECSRAGWCKEDEEGHIRQRRHRNVTRCGCQARLRVKYDRICCLYRVSLFKKFHNHPLETPDTAHWLRCNRIISPPERKYLRGSTFSGIKPCQAMDYLELLKGGPGNLGFKRKDGYNCLYRERIELLRGGDVKTALSWLESRQSKDMDLFFRYTVDKDQALTQLFWTDGMSRVQYELFGDVLCFDSTYKINVYDFPLVVFSGVDNHFKTCIFGAGLLYNEKKESYIWLLQQFKEAMNGKTPVVVVTDQDKAMRKAIESEFSDAKHRICCWHLTRNASTNVNKKFSSEFGWLSRNRCSIEQFENRWKNLVQKHGVAANPWVIEIYNRKEIWCEAYLSGNFMAMMTSTQRAESLNSVLKLTINRSHRLTEFLMHYHNVLSRMRVEFYELQVESERTSAYVQKGPLEKLESDAASLFSRKIFFMVQNEIAEEQGIVLLRRRARSDTMTFLFGKYDDLGGRRYVVTVKLFELGFYCECQMLESIGIPCRHIMSSIKWLGIQNFPTKCILPRWTIAVGRVLRTEFRSPFTVNSHKRFKGMIEDVLEDNELTQDFHTRVKVNHAYDVRDPLKAKSRGAPRSTKQNCKCCGELGHKTTTCPENPNCAVNNHCKTSGVTSRDERPVVEDCEMDLQGEFNPGLNVQRVNKPTGAPRNQRRCTRCGGKGHNVRTCGTESRKVSY